MLSANLEKLKEEGYPFSCKIFEDMGRCQLLHEHPEKYAALLDQAMRIKRTERDRQ